MQCKVQTARASCASCSWTRKVRCPTTTVRASLAGPTMASLARRALVTGTRSTSGSRAHTTWWPLHMRIGIALACVRLPSVLRCQHRCNCNLPRQLRNAPTLRPLMPFARSLRPAGASLRDGRTIPCEARRRQSGMHNTIPSLVTSLVTSQYFIMHYYARDKHTEGGPPHPRVF